MAVMKPRLCAVGLNPPAAVGHLFSGFELLGIILVTAIPLGIYDRHGEQIGIAQTPTVAAGYLLAAGIFVACARFSVMTDRSVESVPAPHGEGIPAQA